MKVLLINKKNIFKLNLPKNINSSYWISDTSQKVSKKIIEILGISNNWVISSNEYAQILNSKYLKINKNNIQITKNAKDLFVKNATLEEGRMYAIAIGTLDNIGILYCSKSEDISSYRQFDIINTNEITIGTDNKNQIIYKENFVSSMHAKIYKREKTWYIKNYDGNYGTFVNDLPINNREKKLFNGDITNIMGLKFIMINDSIYINNPENKVNISYNFLSPAIKKEANIDAIYNDDDDIEETGKVEFFYRGPKLVNVIEEEEIKIDPPPEVGNEQKRPILLTIGSSLAMGVMTILTMVATIQGVKNGTASTMDTIVSAGTALAMLVAIIVIPFISIKYDEKTKKKYLNKRKTRYCEYLNKKKQDINKIKEKQKELLYKNYLSADECARIISTKDSRLWERKIEDNDFLKVRIGTGEDISNIKISYPEEKFTMDDDALLDELIKVITEAKTIEDVPITLSLAQKNISSIISKNPDFLNRYVKNIIMQLITFHTYTDLKLVFMVNNNTAKDCEYVKMLPHVWDNSKQLRFFASEYEDTAEVSKYIEDQIENREAKKDNRNEDSYKDTPPYYLIITDDYPKIQNLQCIKKICNSKQNLGFGLLCITNDFLKLPEDCETFIEVNPNKGTIFESKVSKESSKNFKTDLLNIYLFENITKILANTSIMIQKNDTNSLPQSFSFLEMYGVDKIEQLDIEERWRNNDSTLSLKAPIGIDGSGNIIFLDVHEKFHGPHGIIAGSTGSGKSEFIITYILSLALNYHPDDVAFLLIDYKGGGLSGAFQKKESKLPHLVGTITNIDRNGLQRAFISIQSELRRRQILFNEARDMTDEGTIDIYKYQRLYHDGIVKKPIPHLLIICDEFAELKQQQPDFMDELLSVSRIGRSLGVHLILATQKPAGIVSDQIRSNSKFGVCLKVQDTSDSQDIIGKKDGAYLKNPGQFYLQVGNDEYFTLGQSGWAGAKYYPDKKSSSKTDNSLELISNIGTAIKRVSDINKQKNVSKGEQLTNLVKYISDIANRDGIKLDNLWLESLLPDIYLRDLKRKYKLKKTGNDMDVILGEYDDPYNQKQGLVKINLLDKDNVLIYGSADSGKETLVSTLIYEMITEFTSKQVQFYIMDFGSEALKIFRKAPHVGDIVFLGEDEKIEKLFDMIQKELKYRRNKLSDYGGDYNVYSSKYDDMPIINVIINNYEVFDENYSLKYDDLLLTLARDGTKCGILFTFTVNSYGGMRYRLNQNFNKKFVLQLNNEDEYGIILEGIGKIRPSHIFGRGLTEIEDKVYEFQTARICDSADFNSFIEMTIQDLNEINEVNAKPIPMVPPVLDLVDVSNELKDMSCVPIGMRKSDLEIFKYNFIENFMTIITAKDMKEAIEYTSFILNEAKQLKDVEIEILDAEKIRKAKEQSFGEALNQFLEEVDKKSEDPGNRFTLVNIIGMEKFVTDIDFDVERFIEVLNKAKENEKYSFIIIDNPERIQEHTYDDWYKKFIEPNSGIWVGNGVDNQTLFNLGFGNKNIDNKCDKSFGHVIEKGEPSIIKLIGMKGMEEKDG